MTGSANSDRPSRQSHTLLLAIDSKNSVLVEVAGGKLNPVAYSVYGYQYERLEISGRLGFNGELREGRLGWYLLGNGYRAYNPVLMRFHSPDSLSPFGKGGLNAYVYCVGDPVTFSDPTGHMPFKFPKFPGMSSKPASRKSSTSSQNPLIPQRKSPQPTRASTHRDTGSELPAMVSSEGIKQPLDPSTGEPIYEPLPLGRRNWTPRPTSSRQKGMMTYEEMAQRESFTERGSKSSSASQRYSGPPVDRSTKPRKPASRSLPLAPDEIEMGFSTDSTGEVRVDLNTYHGHIRAGT
ncbi:RHS repeat-associated protein [Pseudomonas sp. 2725]|jgi:RHS repeat-associated protein|uniref:RHS repeat-associated core domain-containing protein n=1 Tax=Pseudomonas sp. 2725 TaxID=3156449 RepID=UPI003D19D8AE